MEHNSITEFGMQGRAWEIRKGRGMIWRRVRDGGIFIPSKRWRPSAIDIVDE